MLSRSAAAVGPRRVRRGFFISAVAVLLATLLMGMTSVEPTQASWTDGESVSSSLQAGVVSSPQHVDCAFDRRWFEPDVGTFNNLVIKWEPPNNHEGTIEPEGYRLDFAASGATPTPKNSTVEIGSGATYRGFGEHFSDPRPPVWAWQTNTHTYRFQLTALGPGNWESDSWVVQATISARILYRESSCTVEKVPEGDWGAVTFSGDHTEELLQVDDELLEEELEEEEPETEDERPTATPSPTEAASSPAKVEKPQEPLNPSGSPEPVEEDALEVPAEPSEDAEQPAAPSPEPTTPSDSESGSPSPREPGGGPQTDDRASSDADDPPITKNSPAPHL